MAITFSFSTTPILSGHAIRIYNTSLNWSEYVSSGTDALLTITTLDGDPEFTGGINTYQQVVTGAELEGDFLIDIYSMDLYGEDKIIPDDILTIKIETTGTEQLTYSTDEVFYYNAWKYKILTCFKTVNNIEDINSNEIKFACMVNILYLGLISDIFVSNTTGIYSKFNIFERLRHKERNEHDVL